MRPQTDSGEVKPAKPRPGPRKRPPEPGKATPGTSKNPAVASGAELIWLRADAPLRPPDWRARLAATIARHPDRRVVEKLTTWADARVEELIILDRRPVDRTHPLAEARTLLEPGRRPVRVEVEARLLAGQPASAIARATGVGADAVRWHHDARYHCADRLGARGYILHLFLGGVPPSGDMCGPPFELARAFGYFGGVAMLEPVLEAFRHWDDDRRPGLGGTAAELARRARRLWARAALLAHALPATDLGGAAWRALLAPAVPRQGGGGAR